ncbi:MAG TPA: hypothetical protein DDZ51_22375 [Planctomycetaceae bacterium]|nr:hypothetical protein [Planctomycetaceae bacterium]
MLHKWSKTVANETSLRHQKTTESQLQVVSGDVGMIRVPNGWSSKKKDFCRFFVANEVFHRIGLTLNPRFSLFGWFGPPARRRSAVSRSKDFVTCHRSKPQSAWHTSPH